MRKSRLYGAFAKYEKMYSAINGWDKDGNGLDAIEYLLEDLGYMWSDANMIQEEYAIFKEVFAAYKDFKNKLEIALGIERERNESE